MKILKDLNNLDLLIVSHGGVGSNFIADHLEEHGVKIRGKNGRRSELYRETCHMAQKPKGLTTPILYIYGDIVNSMCSQHSRKLLSTNINKLKIDHNNSDKKDPYNYLYQYENFKDCVKIRYPFKQDELKECFKKLKLNVPLPEIKERSVIHQRPYPKIVQIGVDAYEGTILSNP